MIKIFVSNTSERASKMIHAHLRCEREKGGRHVLIVPDRFALSAERNLMKELGARGLFDVEVMSFTRLAKSVLTTSLRRGLSPESAVMLMRRAVDKVRDELTVYARASRTSGFASEIFAVLGAIRNNAVTVEDLELASEKMTGLSAMKAHDLAVIFKSYEELLKEDYEDMTSRLNSLAEEIYEDEDVARTSYYVLEFNSFTAVQAKILRALFDRARHVAVALVGGRGRANAKALAMDLEERVVAVARASGRDYDVVYERDELDVARAKISDHLYGYEHTSQEKPKELTLFVAQDAREEVVNLASYVRHLVVDRGMRYSDVAVIAGDEEYKKLIKEIFPLYDVAFFADVKEPVIAHPSVRFVLDYLRVLRDGASLKSVLSLMKNPCFIVPREDVDKFENYCLRFSVDRRKLFVPFKYEFDGLDKAEHARTCLVNLLDGYGGKCTTVGNCVREIKDFLERADWVNAVTDLYGAQSMVGDVEGANITEQVCEVVLRLLDEMVEIMGDLPVSLAEFTGILESMLTEAKISLVPFYQDCVYVGDTKESRYSGVKALFLVGANDGVVPSVKKESGILSESELAHYREAGVCIEPTGIKAYREEKAVLADLLAKPTECLYVSCATGSAKEDKKPSSLFGELNRLFGVKSIGPKEFAEARPEVYLHRFSTERGARAELARMPEDAFPEIRALIGEPERLNSCQKTDYVTVPEDKLFRKGTTKISQLEAYFNCPYRNFLQYVLGLKERQEGIKSVDVGILVHAVLEHFFKEWKEDVCAEQALELGVNVAERVLASEYPFIEVDTPAYVDILKDVRTILADVIGRQEHTRFKPEYFEARIGNGGEFDSVDVAGLKLVGVVDRIDCYGDGYVTVIDYKTGNPQGSLNELYFGQKIQLYAYLSSISEKGYKPAGVFYYPVHVKYDTDTSAKHTLKGQVLDDVSVVGALDDTVGAEIGKFVPVKIKDGVVIGGLTAEDFDVLTKYSLKVAEGAIDEMRRGYVAPSPASKHTCSYCPYKSMCAGDVAERDTGKAVKTEIFYRGQENE